MFKIVSYFICFICTLGLTGCVHQPREKIISLAARQKYLQNMQNWHISGRAGVNDGEQNIQASFNWRQHADKYHVYFYSPFSSESLTVIGQGSSFKVISKNQTGQQEIKLETSLPFAQLTFWLKGLRAPTKAQNIVFDDQNRLKRLQQDGWLIEFQSYDDTTAVSLPEKLYITDGHIKVKLQIKNWNN